MNYSKRENAFEKLQTLCNHLKEGLEKINNALSDVGFLIENESEREGARKKLIVAKSNLTDSLEASREALGEVGETYSDAGFIEQSGPEFAEQVISSVYLRLKSVLEPLSKPF